MKLVTSKYVDTISIVQVIGCVFNNPHLLSFKEKYNIIEEDFITDFHKIVFGTIYNLYELGATSISLANFTDFLNSRPKSKAIFEDNKGEEWLTRASEIAMSASFDYYYSRMKKMTLLRAYDSFGIDVTDIYDPDNILDVKKKQLQEDQLDNSTLEQIAAKIDGRITEIRAKYVDDYEGESIQAGQGLQELIEGLKAQPEVGIPLYGSMINSITRGARLKKFYLRSAPTGTGKTRTLIADACNFACNKIYSEQFGCWISNNTSEPTLFITTEQELGEVQTMMVAFLADVDEDHILNGKYEGNEEERVQEAIQLIKDSPLYIEMMPDFSLQDIENTIIKNIRDRDVTYVVLDYIHTSMKILEEITRRSGGVKLREDNILFMMSIRLKDICNKYGIFIISATQLNGSYVESETPDQNLLRGAKAIADKIDVGMVLLQVTDKDNQSLDKLLATGVFERPTLKISIYKNRRGRYKGIYLWCRSNLGRCKVEPMFATTYNYEIVEIKDLKIDVEPRSAF